MKSRISARQLSVISLLSALGAILRVGFGWAAYSLPSIPLPFGFSLYGIFIKIGLAETLPFVCGFAYGPTQGFLTGVLIIAVSDIFSLYGPGLWTPFIGAIIGLFGILGGFLGRFKRNPSVVFLGVSAVFLTMVSELLQNLWFTWYMWAFYMPETPFLTVLAGSLLGGVASTITATVNNVVFFTTVAPAAIKLLREKATLKSS